MHPSNNLSKSSSFSFALISDKYNFPSLNKNILSLSETERGKPDENEDQLEKRIKKVHIKNKLQDSIKQKNVYEIELNANKDIKSSKNSSSKRSRDELKK